MICFFETADEQKMCLSVFVVEILKTVGKVSS